MKDDLDSLATALYVTIDDAFIADPSLVPDWPWALGGVRATAHRQGLGDLRRRRASPQADLAHEKDALAVMVGQRWLARPRQADR